MPRTTHTSLSAQHFPPPTTPCEDIRECAERAQRQRRRRGRPDNFNIKNVVSYAVNLRAPFMQFFIYFALVCDAVRAYSFWWACACCTCESRWRCGRLVGGTVWVLGRRLTRDAAAEKRFDVGGWRNGRTRYVVSTWFFSSNRIAGKWVCATRWAQVVQTRRVCVCVWVPPVMTYLKNTSESPPGAVVPLSLWVYKLLSRDDSGNGDDNVSKYNMGHM